MIQIEGKCAACGDPARRRVKLGNKTYLGCNRCSARARKGTDFWRPYSAMQDERERLTKRMKQLERKGLGVLEIARRTRKHRDTVLAYLSGKPSHK